MPGKIEKAYFIAVEALWSWCNPVYVRERSDNVFLTSEWYYEARAGLFKCQGKSRKHFLPLLRPCEAGASLFMSG